MSVVSGMRKPLFVAALIVLALVLLIELGSAGWTRGAGTGDAIGDAPRPGIAIVYHALFDGILVWTVGMMGLSMVIDRAWHARVQGIASLIFSILMILGAFFAALFAFALLLLMVMLLMAVPFGTLAYLATYGHFEVGAAAGTLGAIMTLKLIFLGLLLFSHQGFLTNIWLLVFIGLSLLLTFIITFLHAFPPGFLVSITDAVGALVAAIFAIIMALLVLIGSIPAIAKAPG